MKTLNFQDKKIFYSVKGEGKTIVLLHGFTESSAIWKKFTNSLSRKFRIIVIDLPGHGRSECIGTIHTMEMMAELVRDVLTNEKVKRCILIGHSMGGYVALAFAERYPRMLKGFGLFHSHAYADSPQERINRDRTIDLVRRDKFGFITTFIPDLFPPEVRGKFEKEIRELVGEAGKMTKEAIIASLEGMKIRRDQTNLLRSASVPVLFILGLRDPRTPVPRISEMISLPARSEVLLLREVGHMGYIEASGETLEMIRNFATGK